MRTQEHIFLIDTCKSMGVIHHSNAVQNILKRITTIFKTDPWKLELCLFTVVTFNSIQVKCLANKVSIETFGTIDDIVCEGHFNLLKGIEYLRQFNSSINLQKTPKKNYTPTLTIITGLIPQEDLDKTEIKYLKENFAIGTGINDSVRSDESSNWEWRYSPIIGTTNNKTVQDYYKRFFNRVITFEDHDGFAKLYYEYSRN
jgi:uncharacterized protein YegL